MKKKFAMELILFALIGFCCFAKGWTQFRTTSMLNKKHTYDYRYYETKEIYMPYSLESALNYESSLRQNPNIKINSIVTHANLFCIGNNVKPYDDLYVAQSLLYKYGLVEIAYTYRKKVYKQVMFLISIDSEYKDYSKVYVINYVEK